MLRMQANTTQTVQIFLCVQLLDLGHNDGVGGYTLDRGHGDGNCAVIKSEFVSSSDRGSWEEVSISPKTWYCCDMLIISTVKIL